MPKILLSIFSFLFFTSTIVSQVSNSELDFNNVLKKLYQDGFTQKDVIESRISDFYYSSSLDLYHTYYQQYISGIPVEYAIANVSTRNNEILVLKHSFVKTRKELKLEDPPKIDVSVGLQSALKTIGLADDFTPIKISGTANRLSIETNALFRKGQIAKKDIEASLVWLRFEDELLLSWKNVVEVSSSKNQYLDIYIDAEDGRHLKTHNRYIECNFDHSVLHNRNIKTNQKPLIDGLASGYSVFDLPLESPNHGLRTTTVDPWLKAGIGNPIGTLGWHNDGNINYTITRGNNVYAYEDQNDDDLPGYSPDGGAMLDFQFPFSYTDDPTSIMDASITNLFHTCNLVHDIVYQYGFDEQAGNYQTNNLGRGGFQNDHVLAEAFDGSGVNNANFLSSSDGFNGVMQMYLWDAVTPLFDINYPSSLSNLHSAQESGFSNNNSLASLGPITAELVYAEPNNACTSITNSSVLTGKIALIDRGSCAFVLKVKKAQDSGAIAAVVVNNIPSQSPFVMGGSDNTITIPAIMVSYETGELIKDELISDSVNMTLEIGESFIPDGSFDNGIVIHEYAHGISNRLTGGPSVIGCLTNREQMGEGWSDFYTLMLTTDWNNILESDSKGIGTYAIGQNTTGAGIRTFPYSTDLTINPFTYADVANAPTTLGSPSPHFIGSIWATMLWEVVWNIIDIEGLDGDIYHGEGGNNIALQLITDALKLQPCVPGFVDGRDAILLADQLRYGGIYKCAIWDAFAKRGLGKSASQGSSDNHTDGIEAFDLPGGLNLSTSVDLASVYENQLVTVKNKAICNCETTNNAQITQVIPSSLNFVGVSNGNLAGNSVESNTVNLDPLDSLVTEYVAKVKLCSATNRTTQLTDDVENLGSFSSSGAQSWTTSNAHSNSPTTSWYGLNYDVSSDYFLTLDNALNIDGPTYLSFYHRFETEHSWDGGVLEISTNGGGSWADLGDNFIKNGYASWFSPFGSHGLEGKAAFTGNSDEQFGANGFIESIVDLSSFDGQSILIRFRFVSDSNTNGGGLNGWYVDDILIEKVDGIFVELKGLQNTLEIESQEYFIETKSLDQSILFVDENSNGLQIGLDWENSFVHLSDALTLAGCKNIQEIHVSEGVYFPANDRDSSFNLISDLTIFGGFPQGGGSRNISNNQTILSGDIGTLNDNSDNTYHVVVSGSNVNNSVLDGVIIEKGNANGSGIDTTGAGILNSGNLTLKDVILQENIGSSDLMNESGGVLTINSTAAGVKID